MRMVAVAIALVAGCKGGGGGAPDAGNGSGNGMCPGGVVNEGTCYNVGWMQCEGTSAYASVGPQRTSTSCTTCTPSGGWDETATCPAGCSLTFAVSPLEATDTLHRPIAFCADTPDAMAGQICDVPADCTPTRAQLAADGTVSGQDYLTCVARTCVSATPPMIPGYLGACVASVPAMDVYAGELGVYFGTSAPCLLAWDAGANAMASGSTIVCVGDWQCPSGSLCDDQVPVIRYDVKWPVCKPGPKGVLTPGMLSP